VKVFISYAHTPGDTPVAQYLAARLRDIGIDTWLDEAKLRGGDLLQPAIEKAIGESNAGLFIISPSWLEREWTAFELDQFDRRDPRVVRRIPILRSNRKELSLPPPLVKMTCIPWLEEDGDGDARFWQIYCALTDTEPGPSAEWTKRGQTVSKSSARIVPPAVARPTSTIRASLQCDRAPQWSVVDTLATQGSNEIIILPGVVGQAHEHFVERIQRMLRMDPPRSVVAIDWPTRPRSREEFREALATALNITPDALAEEMGARLTHSNLVLLHPCVRSLFADAGVVKYYTEWLPQLIEECRPQKHLKCVQPVEWTPDAGFAGQMLTWLRFRGSAEGDAHGLAENMIGEIKTRAASALRVIRLHDLENVTADDLTQFCDLMSLTNRQRSWLLERIDARAAKTALEIFKAIDDYLPDARSLT
jgi:hypothetical protein